MYPRYQPQSAKSWDSTLAGSSAIIGFRRYSAVRPSGVGGFTTSIATTILAATGTVTLTIEPAPGKAEQALRQEDDHDDEDHAERDEIGELIAENARQQLANELEEAGADDGAEQRADAAHDVEDDGVARGGEEHEFRRGELILYGVEHAGKPSEQARQHHRHDLVALDRIADRPGAR